jgi:hypothetical protein
MGDSLEGFSLPHRSLFANEGVDNIAQMREGYAPQPNLNDQMSPKQMRLFRTYMQLGDGALVEVNDDGVEIRFLDQNMPAHLTGRPEGEEA